MIKIQPEYFGKTKNRYVYGKRTKNCFTLPFCYGEFNPLTFAPQDKLQKCLDLLNQPVLLKGKKIPVRIVGVGKECIPKGFGGIPSFEFCYSRI